MSETSRRKFLKTASVATAAAGAVAVVPSLGGTADAQPVESGPAHEGSFAVWVKNAQAGEIVVLVGESEVVYQDKALATRLARIAATAKS
jgi:hypothetical protein